MDTIELTGKVKRGAFGKGSKSAATAIYLDTGKEQYKLKKFKEPSFGPTGFEGFIGKRVKAEGYIREYYFVVVGEMAEI